MTDRELMQQALHTLEGWANHGKWVWPESALEQAKRNTTESITALRERLAQPERIQLTVRDFVVTVGGIEDAVGTPTYWAEWPNKE